MSVFFVNTNETVEVDQKGDLQQTTSDDQSQVQSEAQVALQQFWPKVLDEIKAIATMDLRQQVLPLARIKKIMKLDEEVKMISAEAPLLFAKAAEIFIHELTLRAWVHTEDNKRRTLQRNDIAMAITKFDQFDFLIDIVPRDDIKPNKPREDGVARPAGNSDQVHYYLQLAQQAQQQLQHATLQPSTSPSANTTNSTASQSTIQIVQPQVQTVQVNALDQTGGNVTSTTTSTAPTPVVIQQSPTSPQPQGGNIQIVQQIMTPGGEIQQIPIQLTPQQLQMIRMQLQSNTNQPLIIQAAPIQTIQPQVIQVTQQNSNGQPVYLAENNGNNESE
ncbi:hypothetical protein RN001_001027 [Aquatica leii]|uniref:Nuclear transcription factor Y subunit gamma n=1 Tax=Aquatica leii TaxID=1421715 RepID=A0AAN7PKS8_9COLE|nr:hypothetical protein RN001_001027 [Aquatica leii]